MRLLLVGNYEPDDQKSMLRYCRLLDFVFTEHEIKVTVIAPKMIMGGLVAPKSPLRKWLAYIDKFILFWPVFRSASRRHDHIHICDHSNSIYIKWCGDRKRSITCHDVIAIQAARGEIKNWHVGVTGRIFQSLILDGMASADYIFCVSTLTSRDLLKLSPLLGPRTHLLPNPIDPSLIDWGNPTHFSDSSTRVKTGEYFLHVGSGLPRKNRSAVVRIVSNLKKTGKYLKAQILFVGPSPDSELALVIAEHEAEAYISFITNVDSATLRAAYRNAIALIFPSENEGFGWPIIEAQALGCPVFASAIAPLPEVGGPAAVYFSLEDLGEAATIISRADLDTMRKLGTENAQRYSTGKLWETFSSIVGWNEK